MKMSCELEGDPNHNQQQVEQVLDTMILTTVVSMVNI